MLGMITPPGRTLDGMKALFAGFEREISRGRRGPESTKSGGRADRKVGRPWTASRNTVENRRLKDERVSRSEIARRLEIGRTSVRQMLALG
jgi:DNA invertase Pin-like site-specific DNA recombinase